MCSSRGVRGKYESKYLRVKWAFYGKQQPTQDRIFSPKYKSKWMDQGWLIWHSGERDLGNLMSCCSVPMWPPLPERCHIRSCWSGPARGQKAEIGAEMKPTIRLSSILGHWLNWPGGRGAFSKTAQQRSVGPVLMIQDGFPVPSLLFSRKEKQGGQISL